MYNLSYFPDAHQVILILPNWWRKEDGSQDKLVLTTR